MRWRRAGGTPRRVMTRDILEVYDSPRSPSAQRHRDAPIGARAAERDAMASRERASDDTSSRRADARTMTSMMTAAAPTTATRLARRRRRRASTTIARDATTPSTSARVDGLKNEGAYAVLARAAALEGYRGIKTV